MTMGGDFQYQDARTWFRNLDLLIAYTNLKAGKQNLKIKLFYSTPQCYLKAVKDANQTFPTKQDDFFPYASDPHAYWTGYFTSRPTTKYFERLANTFLQMSKHLQVLGNLKKSNMFVLNELKSAMGIMQHHDAITGTEKQHVANDYERILNNAIEDVLVIPREAFSKFMRGEPNGAPQLSYTACRLNESSCSVSENSNQFVVTVYNHLAWSINESMRIPVLDGEYEVYNPKGNKKISQLVPIPNSVLNIPTRHSKATQEIVFIAKLEPLSYKNFYIKKVEQITEKRTEREEMVNKNVANQRVLHANDDLVTFKEGEFNEELGKNYLNSEMAEKRSRREERLHKKLHNQEDFNLNDYWKRIKDEPIKYIDNNEYENEDMKIPDRPVYNADSGNSKTYQYDTLAVDVMKDAKNLRNKEMEKAIAESRRLLHEVRLQLNRASKRVGQFGNLNDEEKRMLSDDPLVVTRFPQDSIWETENFKLNFNSETGELIATSLPDGLTTKLEIEYGYYIGTEGNNKNASLRASGAYILRPTQDTPENIDIHFNEGVIGPVVKEIALNTDNNIASTIRLYDGLKFIENDWVVGPIDINDKKGKEYVVNYVTSIVNNGQFYTDSNGRQLLKRELGKRPQYNVTIAEPVAANYYPVTNQIAIQDDDIRFSVLTDRSEGGSSLQEGHIELMLHRRLLNDDAFGVGEALNETVLKGIGLVVRGRHRLVISKNDRESKISEKKLVKQFDLQPQVFVSDAKDISLSDWLKFKNRFSFANELPVGLHLLTLEPWNDKLLIRLENYLEVSDRESTTIEIDLNTIFTTIDIKSFKEATLAVNRWMEDVNQWSWNVENNVDSADENFAESKVDNDFKVKIKARQIRTFVLDYEFK